MTAAAVQRHVDELIRRCYAGLDAVSLRAEVLRRLRTIVPVDAVFFATVDPATILFTSAMAEEPLGTATPLFLENEFGRDDVNKFAALASSGDPVSSLDRATGGDRPASARYNEIMAPLQLGDELRAALVVAGSCWGVMCLHREDSPAGFSPAEVDVVRQVAGHVAEGLRRGLVLQRIAEEGAALEGPGVLLLDDDMAVASMNAEAERLLADLGEEELPVAVRAVAAAARSPAERDGPTRIRTASGRWLIVHASRLGGSAGLHTAVVLEPARRVELASLFLAAHGLTPAQMRVAELVLQGRSTRQIVNQLQISSNTVQEHLGVVFDKFGIGSRRELVATLLGSGQTSR